MNKITQKYWSWEEKGNPENLVLKEKPIRKLEDDEILIENSYIGLNPVDWKIIKNGNPNWKMGHIPGVDGAGKVIQVGKNMSHIHLNTRVCYHSDLTKDGSFSTHTIVKGNRIIYTPEKISDSTAAAFPCPGLTAWQAIQKIPSVTNKLILINGAGGSVAYFLTQLLLQRNAKIYITASPKHHEEFLQMGVIKAYDYKDEKWQDKLKQDLHNNALDIIFDTTSPNFAKTLLPLLGYYGHIITILGRIENNPLPAFTSCVSLHEIALGAFHQFASSQQIAELMSNAEMLLNEIGNEKLMLRKQKISDFQELPKKLEELMNTNTSIKHIIKV